MRRRKFLKTAGASCTGLAFIGQASGTDSSDEEVGVTDYSFGYLDKSDCSWELSSTRISSQTGAGSTWRITFDIDLGGDETALGLCRNRQPKDGIGIEFAGDRWGNIHNVSAGSNIKKDAVIKHDDGVTAEYNSADAIWGQTSPITASTSLEFDLEKQEDGEHSLYAHYGHTWKQNKPTDPISCSIDNAPVIGVGIGPFSIGFPEGGSAQKSKLQADHIDV